MFKPDESSTRSSKTDFRLPHHVLPSRYDLTLRPDLTEFTFTGEEVIDIKVLEATDFIRLNVKELEVQEAYAVKPDGTRLNGKVEINQEDELATIKFNGTLGAGDWKLHARFSGTLNDKLKGFYRSFWTDDKGEKHAIATTQFEATDARRAFPCFDEPNFKATFKVALVVDENLTALSNGRILKEEILDDRIQYVSVRPSDSKPLRKKRVEFAETMVMSTYLVALIVGEFRSSKPVNVNGKEVRIWCVPGKEHLTDFALKAAAFGLDWYEKYFDIPYPGGDKVDHIAIPDFASGAMENLGLITYRETALLLDEKTAAHVNRKRVAEVVLHELAHMWFGDLVTMDWWNGLWLNESFATFMENLCLSHWKPDWNVWEEFALGRAAAARLDALKSTHPIECPIDHPNKIDELFDLISYEKGCSVLYQIHQFIGKDAFQKGIRAYLKKHAYKNTQTHDLWDALEESCRQSGSNVPVREIMDAWVFTPGHPVIEVKEGEQAGFITLSQKPFKFIQQEQDQTTWPIPVTMRIGKQGSQEEKKFVLSGPEQNVYAGEGYDYIVVNAGGSGFYRVVYASSLNARLFANVQGNLSVVERFNLINDSWATVRARITPVTDYLEMVKTFQGEQDPNVWATIAGSLRTLHRLVSGDHRGALEKVIRDLVGPAVARLGWDARDNESVQVRELRGTLINVLGTIGDDKETQTRAASYFDLWKADKAKVEPNVVPALVTILAHSGDEKRYDEFFQLSKAATTPQETLRFLNALAHFRDKNLLDQTITKCLSEDVRTQDAPYLFAQILTNQHAAEAAWKFLKTRFDDMVKAYPENGVVRMCGAVESLDTPQLADEVRQFFAATKVKSGDMAVAQMLEQLEINLALRQEQSDKLAAHLLPATTGGAIASPQSTDPAAADDKSKEAKKEATAGKSPRAEK